MSKYGDKGGDLIEELRICGIYCITNIINGKRYVGQTSNTFKRRWAQHKSELNKNKHNNPHLQNSWNKYGEDNFIFEVLEECEGETIDNAEIFWIYTFRTLNREYGYNLDLGGGRGHSEETNRKISKSLTGKPRSDEVKRKLSIANKGKKMSEASRLKISQTNTGAKRSEEAKRNIANAKIGKKKINNKSGFVGVSWSKKAQQWTVSISMGKGKNEYLGQFKDKLEAAKAYDRASWDTYNRLDILNFPEDYQDIAMSNSATKVNRKEETDETQK